MKRASLWAVAVGALCASLPFPGTVEAETQSIWDIIDARTNIFADLVLINNDAYTLDQCGPNDPYFTALVPYDEYTQQYLDDMQLNVPRLAADPATTERIVSDHMVNGWITPDTMLVENIAYFTSWSGLPWVKPIPSPSVVPVFEFNVFLNEQLIDDYVQACNGAVMFLEGPLYQVTKRNLAPQAKIIPYNLDGAPMLTSRPSKPIVAEEGSLPETR